MNAKGKVILLMPELYDPLDYEFLQGVQDEAAKRGYDILVFSGILNATQESEPDSPEQGLENIYSLLCQAEADGIIIAAERFRERTLIHRIYNLLEQVKTPCLVVGEQPSGLPYLNGRQSDGMYHITKHLIEVHNCKRIYCLAGVPGQLSSEQRLDGFKQAMSEHHLYWGNDTIFYGYYWKGVPEELGASIAEGKIPMPDAVACANDVMAIMLIETLRANGIRVPEDIAVTGYDDSWDALFHSLTTVSGRDLQLGADAFLRLYEIMTGEQTGNSSLEQKVRLGKSCGCDASMSAAPVEYVIDKYFRSSIVHSTNHHTHLALSFIDEMAAVRSLQEWIRCVDCVAYALGAWDRLDICLCQDWRFDFERPEHYRQVGYSDRMYLALSKRMMMGNQQGDYDFPTRQLLPGLTEPHEPRLVIFTSLHFKGQIFGYVATTYRSLNDVELGTYYVQWCDVIASGLNHLQRVEFRSYLDEQITLFSRTDPQTGLPNRRGFMEMLPNFLEQCAKQKQTPALILIYPLHTMETEGYDGRMLFVTALGNVCGGKRHPCVLSEHVFGVLQRAEDGTEQALLDAIYQEMRALLGDVRGIEPPELLAERQVWHDRSFAEMQAAFVEGVARLEQRASVSERHYTSTMRQLQQLRKEIMTAPQENWSLDEIVKKTNMSRSHVQRLYRKTFGISCIDDVIAARLRKACQLLTCTDLRINEIGFACGYQSESHFMRQFKEKMGITALQYRKQNMN